MYYCSSSSDGDRPVPETEPVLEVPWKNGVLGKLNKTLHNFSLPKFVAVHIEKLSTMKK